MAKASDSLLDAIGALVNELPPATIADLASQLEVLGGERPAGRLVALGRTQSARSALTRMDGILREKPEVTAAALGLAIRAASRMACDFIKRQAVEIAWTGPGTEAVPLRRVDQVMYELIDGARDHLLLVTYAAYRAAQVIGALRRASDRGVRTQLVVELAEASGGSLTFDSVSSLREAVPGATILWWPRERRGATVRRGSMHAKCLVVDRTIALVSSANLTDHALESNMELGVVIRGGDLPARIALHFDQLALRGELVPVAQVGPSDG